MTDKLQKIKDWISKEQDGLMDAKGNFEFPEHEGAYHILCNLDAYIDSLQEEPVSDGLEEAARKAATWHSRERGDMFFPNDYHKFIAGAKWQKEQMMTKAIDMIVGYWMPNGLQLNVDETENPYNIDEGNKVKLIIIKDE